MSTSRRIDKIYFLVHPVTWTITGYQNGKLAPHILREDEFLANLELEKRVRVKQDELIAHMKGNEALILYPIGESKAMQDLEEYTQNTLGERCYILRRGAPAASTMGSYLPEEILAELSKEVMGAYIEFNYSWNVKAVKVLYTSRAYAYDIEHDFIKKRNLIVDPLTVKAEAFGEGFEQCAMTWKGMIPGYLGWRNPIENNYELSVSGAPFLIHARFRERIALAGDVRLFLWESGTGRPFGLYARAGFRLRDHQYFARLPLLKFKMEIFTISVERRWPVMGSENLSVQIEGNHAHVAVLEGCKGKLPSDEALYIFGDEKTPYEVFKETLAGARISTRQRKHSGNQDIK